MQYKLEKPIMHGSETISELTFREPVAKDLRALPVDPKTGDLLDLAAKLAAQPPSVIDKLSIPDAVKVLELVGNALGVGLETGEKS